MKSLICFTFFLFLSTVSASCAYHKETFSCVNQTCSTAVVECFNGKLECQCKSGHIWRENDPNVCGYEQKSLLKAALLQGLLILVGISGAGMIYLGHTVYGGFQLVVTIIGPCLLVCLFGGIGKMIKKLTACGWITQILFVLATFAFGGWWLYTVVVIATGDMNDSHGCPTA